MGNETTVANPNNWHSNPRWNGRFNIWNALFLITSPLVAFIGTAFYIAYEGFRWSDLGVFFAFFAMSGFSVTAGYHRYFAHRAYECNRVVQFFYLLFGAAAFENSALVWSSNHRYHHRYCDKEGDPYNIQKGFFWAHMGWIFFKDPEGRSFDNVPYLTRDRLIMWQHKYCVLIAFGIGVLLPTLVAWTWGRPMAGFLWGGWLRIVVVHHATFLINSASHMVGSKPHSEEGSARNCWWLAFFTFGEGYHNFHHAYASDYRNGYRWYHFDPSKWLIYGLYRMGLARKLNRIDREKIRMDRKRHAEPSISA
jgi:stearoyl-CoA desaturase (delta-9 desaturase)